VDRIEDEVVRDVMAMIDRSPLVATVEQWRDQERRGTGGRPETFPVRALLVAMVLCPGTGHPVLATAMAGVLFRRISATMRDELGVPPHRAGSTCGDSSPRTATSGPGST